jgi:hypothetical protein
MKRLKLLISMFSVTALVLTASAPVLAAKPVAVNSGNTLQVSMLGNDVSYPQCNKTLPKGQQFGIVGVNNGLANGTNGCFASELAWANGSGGNTVQPRAALYVNTGNPGDVKNSISDWPMNNNDVLTGLPVNDTLYGQCSGNNDQACSWQFGYNMAELDAKTRIGSNNPSSFMWWLDVETVNSWDVNTVNNVADLEGMVSYYRSIAAQVGLYSTSYQWKQITGNSISPASGLNGLPSWLPGARSLNSAKSNCNLPPLTTAGIVYITQYVSSQTDYDYSCI